MTGKPPSCPSSCTRSTNIWGCNHQRVCYTIHNFGHQGVTGETVLWATGLTRPHHFYDYERLRDDFNRSALNLMKGAIVYANFVTTVSPQHAWEAQYTDQGQGLGHALHMHRTKFGGVLNGVDYDLWNPETDQFLPVPYGSEWFDGKYANKRALRDRFLLADSFKPLVASIGRLDRQKGVELIRHAIFYTLAEGGQFVLLGSSPDPAIAADFWRLKHELNDNQDCHLELAFSVELAHLIYAGADMLVMPSLFEPCGLTQMVALKYGTVPVVRAIGGLIDTVFDRDHAAGWERNGYVFHEPDAPGLESALSRAIGLWHSYPEEYHDLQLNGMRTDHSWAGPGADYLNIYEHIRHK